MGPALRLIHSLIFGLILDLVLPSQLVLYMYVLLCWSRIFTCSTPGFSGLYNRLVSMCSGTRGKPRGMFFQCWMIFMAINSSVISCSPILTRAAHSMTTLIIAIYLDLVLRFTKTMKLCPWCIEDIFFQTNICMESDKKNLLGE